MNEHEGVALARKVAASSLEAWRSTRDFADTDDNRIIDLTIGDPILAPHRSVREALRGLGNRLVVDNDPDDEGDLYLHRYRWPDLVDPELSAAAILELRKTGIPIDSFPNSLVVGVGVSQLMSAIFHLCARTRRKILMFLPTYGLHLLFAEFAQSLVRAYPCQSDDGCIGPSTIEKGLKEYPDTDVICLVNPNNPTGQVWSADETQNVAEIIVRYQRRNPQLIAVVDEIYCDVILDPGTTFKALAAVAVDGSSMFEKVITLRGVSKAQGGARIRVGIAAAAQGLMRVWNLDSPIWRTTLAPSELDQKVAAAMWSLTPESYYRRAAQLYRENLELVEIAISRINAAAVARMCTKDPVASLIRPKAGFFCVVGFPLLRRVETAFLKRTFRSDRELVDYFNSSGLGVMPGSAHGFEPDAMKIRISLSVPIDLFSVALKRLRKAIGDLFW